MSNHFPIPSPPTELVAQWIKECDNPEEPRWQEYEQDIAIKAVQWGADQELEACCKWLPKLPPWSADDLRRHRRPKPPSLKEQALEQLGCIQTDLNKFGMGISTDTIRRALEALDD